MTREQRNLLARFETTLDLHVTGVAMMRERLRRQHPDLSARQRRRLLAHWLGRHDEPVRPDLCVRREDEFPKSWPD